MPSTLEQTAAVDEPVLLPDSGYEVVNGERKELHPMGAREVDLASIIDQLMGSFARTERLGKVVTELLFRLDSTSKLQRRPDVAFVSASKWPIERLAPSESAWALVPDLAVEVISPTDLAVEVNQKLRDYFRCGVRKVWHVWPAARCVDVYESRTEMRVVEADGELTCEELLPGFRLPMTDLFPPETTD